MPGAARDRLQTGPARPKGRKVTIAPDVPSSTSTPAGLGSLPPDDADPASECTHSLLTAVAQLQEVVAHKNREIRQLEAELLSKRKTLEDDFVAKAQAEAIALQRKLRAALEEKANLDDSLQRANRLLEDRDQAAVRLQAALTVMRAEMDSLKTGTVNARDQEMALQAASEKDRRIEALQEQLVRSQAMVRTLEIAVRAAEDQPQAAARLEDELRSYRHLPLQIEQRDLTIRDLQHRLDAALESLATQKKEVARLTREVDGLLEAAEDQEEALRHAEGERGRCRQELMDFHEEVKELQQAAEEKTQRVRKYEGVIAKLQRELELVEGRPTPTGLPSAPHRGPSPSQVEDLREENATLTALVWEQKQTIQLLRTKLEYCNHPDGLPAPMPPRGPSPALGDAGETARRRVGWAAP